MTRLQDRDARKVNVDLIYTDDVTFIQSYETKINIAVRIIPDMLLEEGLYINNYKTEKHQYSRHNDIKWRNCNMSYDLSIGGILLGNNGKSDELIFLFDESIFIFLGDSVSF